MKKKILKKKVYKIECTWFDDNTNQMKRYNNGFSVMELMGILSLIQMQLKEMLVKQVEPQINKIIRKSKNAPFIHKD